MSPFREMAASELADVTGDCASCKDAMFEWAFALGGPIEWNEWQKGFALVRKAFPSTAPSARLPGYTVAVKDMYHEAMELLWGEDWQTQLKEQRSVPLGPEVPFRQLGDTSAVAATAPGEGEEAGVAEARSGAPSAGDGRTAVSAARPDPP